MPRDCQVRGRNARTLKRCAVPGCEVQLLTGGKPRICGACVARGVRRVQTEAWRESPDAIERVYQAALGEIKRRPRVLELSWPSSLMRFQ